MRIIMTNGASPVDIGRIISLLERRDIRPFVAKTEGRTHVCAPAVHDQRLRREVADMPAVSEVRMFSKPYRLVSREFRSENTVVDVGGRLVGDGGLTLIAGPCAVENRDQLFKTAESIKASGAEILRGGAFKPRTSPYDFQGLGEQGLELLAEARDRFGLRIVTEILSPEDLESIEPCTDILQVGARNMQNYRLLEKLAETHTPILLKRGMMATMEELLMSAEYLMSGGNPNVILCERGIRTFERYTRNTLDISAVPALKTVSHLPVIVDPSHAAGDGRLVESLALAAAAAGADGVMLEVHPCPEGALCDGPQSLNLDQFSRAAGRIRKVAAALGR